MLQPSGPANTPCSGWRLKILWPAFRRLEIPQTILVLFRCDKRRHSTRCRPRARNRIFATRDKAAKSVVLPPQRPVGAHHTSHDGRKCGLFSRSLRERETPRVRGGPGRTRTCNQTNGRIDWRCRTSGALGDQCEGWVCLELGVGNRLDVIGPGLQHDSAPLDHLARPIRSLRLVPLPMG